MDPHAAVERALLDGTGIEFAPEYAAADGPGGVRGAGLLADHPVYAAAAARAAGMMERQEGGGAFVAVAVWSSEFSAVNEALQAGSSPADLVAGPPLLVPEPPEAPVAKPAPRPGWRVWG